MDETWRPADFVGGHPALDFLNTVADKDKSRKLNKLRNWSVVRRWAVLSKLLTETEIRRFAAVGPTHGDPELADLADFRETVYAATLTLADQGPHDRRAVSVLQNQIRSALARGIIERDEGRFRWRPDPTSSHFWTDAIALAMEDLLRGDDFARVRRCERCSWLFIDRGRGTGRRWCDMRTCGNRAKAQTFRAS